MSNNTASSNNVTAPDAMDLDSIYLDPASASFSFPHFFDPTVDNVPQLPSSRSTPTRPVVKPNLIHTGGDSWLPLGSLGDMYWSASPYGSPPRNSLDINSYPLFEYNTPFDNDTPSLASSSPHSASSSAPDTSSTAFTLFSIVDDLGIKLNSSPYVGLLVDDIKPVEPAVWQGCIDPAELCAPLREPVDDDGDADDDMSEDDVPLALSLPPPPPPPAPTRKRAHSRATDDNGDDDAWAPAPKKTKKAQTQQKAAAQKATPPTKKAPRRRGPPRHVVAIARPAPLDVPAQPIAQTLLTRPARAATTSPPASSTKKRPAPEAKESLAPSTTKRRKTAAPEYQSGDDEDSYVPSDNDKDKDSDFASPSRPRRRASSSSASTSSKPQAKSKSKAKTKSEGDVESRDSHRFFDPTAGPMELGEKAWLCTALDDEHVCAGIFGRVPDVYRHIVSCHLGEERYLCASCGKRFNRGDARNRHWDSNKGCVEVSYVQQQQAIAAHWKHVKFVDGDLDKDTPLAAYNPNYE
ncbi:hypothetical protein EXIGLDRAFT_698804 [Exidia glandulosa HHB12029]|uniref:C2H2-type domain-containing protein n=1 Tax=Exidia glandulosa HHB12029 TaxID=1314781 RepID=A0A165MIU6_EXIGL|nr:hypothetical protein EXIGLDRAFT_698804 [Exidia glandulosa HHB12029]